MTTDIAVKRPTLGVELGQRQAQFKAALPAHIPVERFVRVVLTAVQTSPRLAEMDRASLWNACMRAAQDGLLPDGREGALVPFKGKVTWIPMVGGIRKKVRNSEAIATWDVHAVHAKDQFQFELGDDPYIKHKPYMPRPLERSGGETDEQYRARLRAHVDPGPLVAVYSVAVLKTGERSRDMMTRADVELVRDTYARKDDDGKFSPMWRNSFDEAAKKTLARRHAKVLPMSTDLDDLLRRDDELYDLKGASDKVLAGPRPKSLSARIDALAGLEDTPHDPETGEVIDQVSGNRLPETTADESAAAGARDAGQGLPLPPASGDQAGRPTSASPAAAPPPDDSLPDDNAALDRVALLQDLMQTGGKIARAKGAAALDRWLDEDLNGDELAVLTAGHTRRLKQIAAEAKSARA
jgi:recombination protein RecT